MTAAGRVVVCGSLHYDIVVETSAWPKTGETSAGSAWFPKLGGKGRNQAVAAHRAGAQTLMIGRVGNDDFGRQLVADLTRRGIDHSGVTVSSTAGSGVSVALFEPSGDYRAIIVSGANLELDPGDVPSPAFWTQVQVLVLQNEIPDAVNAAMAAAARAQGVTVILNAAPARAPSAALAAAIDFLVVNAVEAAQLGDSAEPTTLEEAANSAAILARDFPQVIVTAGKAGVATAGLSGACALAAASVTVVSTHGAGDEFVGCLAAKLAAARALDEALGAANSAAARLISTPESGRG